MLKRISATVVALAVLGIAAGVWILHAWAEQPQFVQLKADPARIKRGEYLVNVVARCGDCHTPRDANGKLDMSRHLQGASMWFTPKVKPRGEWENHAPDITASGRAGKWKEAKMVKFLSSGERSDPPMPAYSLTGEDAQAVTAYLRSLPGRKKGVGKRRDDD